MDPLRFAVIGIGGYAVSHLASIEWLVDQNLGKLTAVIAVPSERGDHPKRIQSLLDKDISLFDSVESFFAQGKKIADVLTVPIGIHQHVPISTTAMQAGLDVYCEKPAAATIQAVDALIAAEKSSGRRIVIGFQHIYSPSIKRLKELICSGQLGQVKAISVVCGWPRSTQYYARNEWTGQMRKKGDWILDSPANSAQAHYLLNGLYLASSSPQDVAVPRWVHAELYRANRISSADTTQLQIETEEGVRINTLLSHCNEKEMGPFMHLECEQGKADWSSDEGKTSVSFNSGETEHFDNQVHDHWRSEGFRDLVYAIQQIREPICTPEFCRSHTLTVNAMHESCPEILEIPAQHIYETVDWEMFPPNTKGNFRRVHHMDEYLRKSYRSGRFLSELEVPWATAKSDPFHLADYDCFPRGKALESI